MTFYQVSVHVQTQENRFDLESFNFWDDEELAKFLLEVSKADDLVLEHIEAQHFTDECSRAMQVLSWKRMKKPEAPLATTRKTTSKRKAA